MAKAEHKQVAPVSREELFQTIVAYESYPKFLKDCSAVSVERKGPGRARAKYEVELMGQKITYTLDHEEDLSSGVVKWDLVESNFFKINRGGWKLAEKGAAACDAHYTLEVEFKVPVPGFILNRMIKGALPEMVDGFVKQTVKRAKASAGSKST